MIRDLNFNQTVSLLKSSLQENTAMAWGVKVIEPLVIMLHVRTMSKYLNGVGKNGE